MTVSLKYTIVNPTLPAARTTPFSPAGVTTKVGGPTIGDVALGCGLISPFQRDGKNDFRHGCGEALIRASVERILGVTCMSDTTHGEVVWMPEFGSLVTRIRHAPVSDATADLARYYTIDALRIWEPRIDVKDAGVTFVERNDPGSSRGYLCEIRVVYDIVGKRRATGVLVAGVDQLVTLTGFSQAA